MTVTCRIDGVSKRFGRTTALQDLSVELHGGITGLLGPNGAGKTTLLRILATALAADRGRLELLGLDPSRVADRVALRARLGYMPQEPGFHERFSVVDFLDYVAILKELTDRRVRQDEVRRVVTLVGLEDKRGERIKALSGGMRRRVALAQALIGDPQLLVLDEPTVGLDPEQRLRFRDLISRIGEDRTVLVSTHQTEDVAALCAEVVVMHDGRALLQGPPRDLREVARGSVWLADERDPDAELAWRTSEGRYRHIGHAPGDAELIEPTIEDGYLRLIGAPVTRDDTAAA